MTNEDFRKLQLTQMEIMDEIHRICVEHSITYYIIGGTALGAVRHGGFIPWDLDIDIAMKRADYDKFKEVCKTSLDSRYTYRDYTNTHNYPNPHALVCINNTVLVNKFDKFNKQTENFGIYLDIFPLDNAPADEALKNKQAEKMVKLKKLRKNKIAMRYEKSFIKSLAKNLIKASLFWISLDKINQLNDDCMRTYNSQDTGYLCSMASHYSYEKQYMPQEVYGTPQLIKFENREYFAPEKLDEYLTRIYKNYMQLPPKNQQKANLKVFESVIFDK